MPQIDFYSGASDKLLIACRLSEKVIQQATKIMVYIPDSSLLNQFDKLLWTFSPISFIPHCHGDDKMANVTPVILISNSEEIQQIGSYEVLLNLHDEVPPVYDRFQRVIEIVENVPEDKLVARKRYRFYQEQGLSVHHHKLDQNQH
ncbi:DNA polymerase III subunit chi [Nitrosomonas communis]|uniref:DNA polymerase III, chi subunit n=1 Tax=Nitrosomonas communis TaxID=44574 RepID=A0A1I4PI19_9PROT|nr:DNA polymerase III subunit chi [Nitrosomonas communis]SFM27337.1 DNA polymerase III, chi subunit [Nitrosomonas communis]